MKFLETYTIPQWAVQPLLYGEYEGLSKKEEDDFDEFLGNITEDTDNFTFEVSEESEFELTNDVDNLGCDCVTLEMIKYE